MEPNPPCEHAWSLIRVKDTWSGPMRLSACVLCRAILREWPSRRSEGSRVIPQPRPGGDLGGIPVVPVLDPLP
jgi:hypothetical protein